MGQKVNPIGLRLGVNRTWDSRWYAGTKDFARLLHEDIKIRSFLRDKLNAAGISKIIIERPLKKCRVTVHTAKPGVVIGKKGADIEKLRKDLAKMAPGAEVHLNLVEVRKPETDAMLVAEGVAQQLQRRVAFRRAMKRAMQSAMRLGAQGIRINVSGRLGGAEIARMEWYREGRVPLHTLRADVDYGFAEANTQYGTIGVKVWIFKGEILEHDPMAQERRAFSQGENRERRDRDGRAPHGDYADRPARGRRPTRESERDDDSSEANRTHAPSDSPRASTAATHTPPSAGARENEINPLASRIVGNENTQKFARLLQRLKSLSHKSLGQPIDLDEELTWLAQQIQYGAPEWTSSLRNRSKVVALDVAHLLSDPSELKRAAATRYLASFAKIIAPPGAPPIPDLATAVSLALRHFHIGYFVDSALTWNDARSGKFRIRLRRTVDLPGIAEPLVLEGLREGAKIEALLNTRSGHGDHRVLSPIDGALDETIAFENAEGVLAPYPVLTLVIDGEIALQQHQQTPAYAND